MNTYTSSALWREENKLQQDLASVRDELSKKEQALRSMTGKVNMIIYFPFLPSILGLS